MFLRNQIISPIIKHFLTIACMRNLGTSSSSNYSNNKPLRDADRIFTNIYGKHDWHLNGAMARGDWHKTGEILKKGSQWILDELENSKVRGRGGSFFPVGSKLKLMKAIKTSCRYVVVNGAEGEPGTCRDRDIFRHEPHKVIEGALIVGHAISAKAAFIFLRARFYNEACNLQTALLEAYAAGLLGRKACGADCNFDIFIQRGGGKYICGEETALLNCVMGYKGRPRKRPPYPAEKGLFDKPTILFNAETVSIVPTICRRGSKWFSELGVAPHSTGPMLYNISGNVERPCTVEENIGIPLRELIEKHAGGITGGWDNLFGVLPGGLSTPLLTKNQCETVTMDSESLKGAKSFLGTGAVIVIDKSHDILKVMTNVLKFYKEESCHQCTPCRLQSSWAYEYAQNFEKGIGQKGEIEWLCEISKWAFGNTICSFADANANVIQGFIRHLKGTIEERIRKRV